MNFLKTQKTVNRFFKLRVSQHRWISDIQRKIKHSYYFMHGDVQLSCSHLGQVLNHSADISGDKTAIISAYQGISKTYTELKNESDRLASGFISLGLSKGDRIGIFSPNCYEWILTQFAAAKAGLILVNMNPALQPMELEYCLNKVECKALVTSDVSTTKDFYKLLCNVIPDLPTKNPAELQNSNLPSLKTILMISESKKDGTLNFKDVLHLGNKETNEKLAAVEKLIQFDDPVNIQFTSGTTGVPKGATLSHHNLINNSLVFGRRVGYNLLKPVACCHLPLFHSFGCGQGSIATILYQGTCVLPAAAFDAVSSLKSIEKYKCTIVFGSPTMYVDILNKYKSNKFNIGNLKQAVIGGAAAPESLLEGMKDVLKLSHIHVGYGSTETSPAVACIGLNDPISNAIKSIMPPLEYTEMKVIDTKGHLVPINVQGELCVRGHNKFMGYWNDEKKTSEVVDQTHWYHSGDLAIMNEYGYIKIVGRIKDMIIRGGENIYPQEVENFMSSHPAVLEVHICGVPDKRMGEEACAWIALKKDMKATEGEIRTFCIGKISNYKIPRYIRFVEEFPKTPTGKIQKFKMTAASIEMLKI